MGITLDGTTGAPIEYNDFEALSLHRDDFEDAEEFDEDTFKSWLLEVSADELLHTVANLRAELKERKSEHGASGRAVQGVQAKIEMVMLEIEGRDERRNAQPLPGIAKTNRAPRTSRNLLPKGRGKAKAAKGRKARR